MNIFLRGFFWWLPIAVAITGAVGATYLAVQQDLRQGADDPQIQTTENGAALLTANDTPVSLVPHGIPLTDIASDLSPWIAVYDANGTLLEASAELDNAPPHLPAGLFNASTWLASKTYVTSSGNETRITWQPREGVRQAVVVVHAANGDFVAAGRSLRLVEEREGRLTFQMSVAWLVTVCVSLFFAFVAAAFTRSA